MLLQDLQEKPGFSAVVDSYYTLEGMKIPRDVRIIWHLEDGDFQYYKGRVKKILWDVKE